MRPFSLKARLTALFVLIFGGSLIAYSIYIYRTVDDVLESGFNLQLREFANEVGDSINYSILWGFQFNPSAFIDSKKVFPFTMREAVIQIRSASGKPLMASKALKVQVLPFDREMYEAVLDGRYVYRNWQATEDVAGNRYFRTLSFMVKGNSDSFVILQVAVPDRYIRENNKRIFTTFVYSIPILLLISGLIGYTYAGYSLMPVNKIIERVHTIRGRNLSERVPVPDVQDEIAKLAVTLNSMLDRVEAAFVAQERFVSDASHQMKTPLAVLKAQIEELHRGKQALSADQEDKLNSLGEEVDSLISLVKNLLILARVDLGEETLLFSEVSLDETVTLVCERLSHIAKRKDIQFSMNLDMAHASGSDRPFVVNGDSDLLASVFQSIIENSIKYSPAKTRIQIQIAENKDDVIVSVCDEGPGIPEEELGLIFERFRRGPASAKIAAGSGLGLSIAKRISDLHGAELKLSNRTEGGLKTIFTIKKV